MYSTLEYKGRTFKLAQWHLDAMNAVSESAFLKAAHAVRIMGGSEKAIAQREVALARSFALGGYDFDAILVDNGFIDNDLLATFLHKLLVFHDATITFALALEMVKDNWQVCYEGVMKANPRNTLLKDKTGQDVSTNPEASNTPGTPSESPGVTS